ncbi:glycan biosynthesis hexose transferase WsfD [Salegentibacter salegens]
MFFGLIVGYYLFTPPQIGLADSADFGRILPRIGLSHTTEISQDKFFNFFNPYYDVIGSPKVPVNIGQVIPLISVGVNNMFYTGTYSIYFLSALYFSLYLIAFYLFLRNSFQYISGHTLKIIFGILSIVILSDIMFVSYFNSFYQEALFLIAAIYVVAFSVARSINYNLLLIALVVLSLSKSQNIIFLIFPFCLVISRYRQLNKFNLIGISFLLIFFMFFTFKEQAQTNYANLYEAVFLGLMHEANSKEQKEILADLHLDKKGYLVNVKRGYWRPNNELIDNKELFEEFYSEVGQIDIIKTYLLNPKIFFKTAFSGVRLLFNNPAQPEHLGNYSKEESFEGEKTVVQTPWGYVVNYLALPIYFGALLLSLIDFRQKRIIKPDILIFTLILFIPVVYLAILIAGGINDFVKHNLSVYYMISFLFLLCNLKLFEIGRKKNRIEINRNIRC